MTTSPEETKEKKERILDGGDVRIALGFIALISGVGSISLRASIVLAGVLMLTPELFLFVASMRKALTGKAN
jgi:hypothetical protein